MYNKLLSDKFYRVQHQTNHANKKSENVGS